eukprot:2234733-Prymnesium_polylepis.2
MQCKGSGVCPQHGGEPKAAAIFGFQRWGRSNRSALTPVASMRSCSPGESALWSVDKGSASNSPPRLLASTARQSPAPATVMAVRVRCATIAHAPDSLAGTRACDPSERRWA